jgi:hypothetical protein
VEKIGMAVGHYSPRLVLWILLLSSALTLTGFDIGMLAAILFAAAIGGILLSRTMVHDIRLCKKCITRMPTNPGAVVERKDRSLRFAHFVMVRHWWAPLAYLIGMIAVQTAVFGLASFGEYAEDVIFEITVTWPCVLLYMALNTHTRLRPWCPYCRWGSGGPKEVVPDPDPSDRRPVPV